MYAVTRLENRSRLRFQSNDHRVTLQRLEKRLKAAVDDAAQGSTVDLDPADPGRPRDLLHGRRAHEADLHFSQLRHLGHAGQATWPALDRNRWNHRFLAR